MIELRWDIDEYGRKRSLFLHTMREERKGKPVFFREDDGGTTWGPIMGEEHRQEPKSDWYSKTWGVRLFGRRLTLNLGDEE